MKRQLMLDKSCGDKAKGECTRELNSVSFLLSASVNLFEAYDNALGGIVSCLENVEIAENPSSTQPK